jgi:cystatin-C
MNRLFVLFVIAASAILPNDVLSDNSTTTIRTTKKPIANTTSKKPTVATTTATARPIDGGYSSIPVDDPTVQEMASFALAALTKTHSSATAASSANSSLSLVKILSAAKQIVAGINYKMSLQLKQGDSTTLTCQVVVFDQVWTGTREVTSSSCSR